MFGLDTHIFHVTHHSFTLTDYCADPHLSSSPSDSFDLIHPIYEYTLHLHPDIHLLILYPLLSPHCMSIPYAGTSPRSSSSVLFLHTRRFASYTCLPPPLLCMTFFCRRIGTIHTSVFSAPVYPVVFTFLGWQFLKQLLFPCLDLPR